MGTFWDAFGWFLEVVGQIWGDEEIVPEIEWPKVTREIRKLPEVPGNDPCVPLKQLRRTVPGLEGL